MCLDFFYWNEVQKIALKVKPEGRHEEQDLGCHGQLGQGNGEENLRRKLTPLSRKSYPG